MTCTKCKLVESRVDHSWCQGCLNKARRAHYHKNPTAAIQASAEWGKRNPDKKKINQHNSYIRHKDQRLQENREYLSANPSRSLYIRARARAVSKGLEFRITVDDIKQIIPECCPVFGTAWRSLGNGLGPDSMTLDRIDPRIGYVPGNVQVISHKANTMKSNATIDEICRLASWLRGVK